MEIFLLVGVVIFLYMSSWFVLSLLLKRNDVADIAWGLGFILVGWVSYFNNPKLLVLLIATLTTVWGIRLSLHIYLRNKGKQEDFRYKKWREEWGGWFYLRSYLQVYVLQGLFMYLISLPVLIASYSRAPFGYWVYLGILIWVIGFLFESVGDWQLGKFIRDSANKEKIMKLGLWRYTRHPNYFGEVFLWWGIFITTLSSEFWWIAVWGPLTISYLILKVSGIPMLEKKYEGNQEFEEYKKETNAFLPWFPGAKK